MGLGRYNSLGEYCGPRITFSVFLVLVCISSILLKTVQLRVGYATGDRIRIRISRTTIFIFGIKAVIRGKGEGECSKLLVDRILKF